MSTVKSKEQIIEDIRAHMQKRGGAYGDWFVGIGVRGREQLFQDHGVREKGDRWILRRADSPRVAHDVLDYFVNILATDTAEEDPAGGAARVVYAYRKSEHTRP